MQKHVETHRHQVEIGSCEISLSNRSGHRNSDFIVLVWIIPLRSGCRIKGTCVQDGANAAIHSTATAALIGAWLKGNSNAYGFKILNEYLGQITGSDYHYFLKRNMETALITYDPIWTIILEPGVIMVLGIGETMVIPWARADNTKSAIARHIWGVAYLRTEKVRYFSPGDGDDLTGCYGEKPRELNWSSLAGTCALI